MAAGVGARPPAYNPAAVTPVSVAPIGLEEESIQPSKLLKKQSSPCIPETIEFDKIDSATFNTSEILGVVSKYFFTNLQHVIIKIGGRESNTRAMVVSEFDQKLLSEANVNGLYRQGRLITIMDKENVWFVSKAFFDKMNELGCGQIAIVRTFSVQENGQSVLHHKVMLRNVAKFGMTVSSASTYAHERDTLLDMIKAKKSSTAVIDRKHAEGKVTQEMAAELKKSQIFRYRLQH